MADKIVQLTDKNSNNLYPIAGAVHENAVSTGGLSASAVTTPKIANSAVTSDKIDWTTIDTGWVDIPYDTSCEKPNLDFAKPIQYRKVNKTVFLRGNFVPKNGTTPKVMQQVGTLPAGIRPDKIVRMPVLGQYTSYMRLEVTPEGVVQVGYKIQGATSAGNADVTESNTWTLQWYSIDGAWFFVD